MAAPKTRLFFLHLPKTGGTTLTGSVGNRFDERDGLLYYVEPQPDLSELNRFRYVSGHFPIDFVDRFAERPFVFTVLRDPIERALSAYRYLRTRPAGFEDGALFFDQVRTRRARLRESIRLASECATIEEFVSRSPALATFYFGNVQARMLSASRPGPGDERLGDALGGLEQCDLVALSERLDESADLLTERLGWGPLAPIPRVNVSPGRLARDQLSPTGLAALRALTAVDRELYGHAVERFERQLSDRAPDPTAAVEDAPVVSDLRFDRAMMGGGWVMRERVHDSPPVCWIGDTNKAWVELTRPREARALRVEIPHVLDQSILESLRISVDGEVAAHRLSEADGFVVAEAPVEPPPRSSGRRTVRVTLEVDRAIRPSDVSPESDDDRQLSIAVQRIALGSL